MADRCLFEVDLTSPANRFYHIGISAAFLAELYSMTKDPAHLRTAETCLAFAERLPSEATGCLHLCKVGWGAALVARETSVQRWQDLACRVAQEVFLDHQKPGGLYDDFVSVMSDDVPTPVEAVAPGHEIAAEFSYEMHFLARGLSKLGAGS